MRVAACHRDAPGNARSRALNRTPHRAGTGAAIVLAGLLMWSAFAHAAGDGVQPFVEEKIARDDNVFRISKDVDPEASIGSPSRADTYRTTSVGLNIDLPASRQRIQAGYTWSDTRYNRFTDLDFTGHDARVLWLWQVGNDASGQLGYTETSALASFANIQSRTSDRLRTRQAFYDAAVLVTPRWRAQAGVRGLEQSNSDPARRSNDVDILISDIGLSYVTPASTSVGLGVRSESGRFPNRQVVAGSSFDNAYRQYGAAIVADWTVTGASRVTARAGRVSRRYSELPQRDFSGNTIRVDYEWRPTGRLSATAVAQRDISVYEDVRTSFVLVKGLTLRAALGMSEKAELSAALDYSIRDFLGDPGLVSGASPSRTDRVRSATAAVSYRAARNVTLLMSAQREIRESSIPLIDYEFNVYSVSARIAF
ncbi:MAG: XrtB/PEP-CTERM-associated polysaccharide biosynthesis outer membrane protein EpsL [Burkholderiales bacterium]